MDASRSHSETQYPVGLVWTWDRPVEETSTWKYTTDRHPCSGETFRDIYYKETPKLVFARALLKLPIEWHPFCPTGTPKTFARWLFRSRGTTEWDSVRERSGSKRTTLRYGRRYQWGQSESGGPGERISKQKASLSLALLLTRRDKFRGLEGQL